MFAGELLSVYDQVAALASESEPLSQIAIRSGYATLYCGQLVTINFCYIYTDLRFSGNCATNSNSSVAA